MSCVVRHGVVNVVSDSVSCVAPGLSIRDDGRVLFFPPAEQDDRRRRRCSAIIFHPEKARAAMVIYIAASAPHFEKWCSIK